MKKHRYHRPSAYTIDRIHATEPKQFHQSSSVLASLLDKLVGTQNLVVPGAPVEKGMLGVAFFNDACSTVQNSRLTNMMGELILSYCVCTANNKAFEWMQSPRVDWHPNSSDM